MVCMEVVLELDGVCIETAARREYEKLVRYLLNHDDEEKYAKLEFLVEFLERADFHRLRSSGFDGSRRTRVRVSRKDGEFLVEEV
ncbi:hypothetical protein [Geoglobus ahangari]|nr:hypothetical protein [Geoglobus ahangari]